MRKFMMLILVCSTFLACNHKNQYPKEKNNFKIGIISDCQYCNCETNGLRNYKKSPDRLEEAVEDLNRKSLTFTIHLGDFIDRDFSSFDTLVPIWNKLNSQKYHVLGNHDFSVADSLKSKVFDKMNIDPDKRYYTIVMNKWRFLILDGNDLSFHGSLNPSKIRQRDSIHALLAKDSIPYLKEWNGGLSKMQLSWVRTELEKAEANGEKVGFYCHFPIHPLAADNLWNRNDLIELISEFDCVKLFFNGHNHEGAYEYKGGVHYLTFKAMVNTEDSSSYAIAQFQNDTVIIEGFGRELSRKLAVN